MRVIEEEITLAEFADRFLGVNDLETPEIYDLSTANIEVLTLDSNGVEVYAPIQSFIVKEPVTEYYTDGKIKVSSNHRFIENGVEIFAKDHPDFIKEDGRLMIVDIEVPDYESYLANGRLNHNTTAGGKAIAYHSSVRIRLAPNGQIKGKRNGKEDVLGIKTVAKVIKNRMGPPLRTAKFDIYFDRGIDDETSLLELLKELQIADNNGAWYVLVDPSTGETLDLKFQAKTFKSAVLDNPEIYSKVKQWVYDRYIVKYKDSTSSDIEIIHTDTIIED